MPRKHVETIRTLIDREHRLQAGKIWRESALRVEGDADERMLDQLGADPRELNVSIDPIRDMSAGSPIPERIRGAGLA